MPDFDFQSRHDILVPAPRSIVAEAVEAYRLDSSPVVRLLFRLRGLGASPGSLRSLLTKGGFTVLGETPGQEFVLGVAGRFWALDERAAFVPVSDAQTFIELDAPGIAKAAVSLRILGLGDDATRVETETRVRCTDAAAHRRFAVYWTLIRPFSGWIRHEMLRGIRREALIRQAAPPMEAQP